MEHRCLRLAVLICIIIIYISNVVTSQASHVVDVQIESFIADAGQQRPVDLILIMDRSTGVGREVFYRRIKKLCRAILQQYVPLHIDYARLAVITFGKDVSLVMDYISSPSVNSTSSKCEILSEEPSSPWRRVVYYEDKERAPGTNLQDSLHMAKEIFAKGLANRRQVFKQVVLLLTDGDYQESEDPFDQVTVLKADPRVVVYTVGCGSWQRPGQVRELASLPEYYAGCRSAWYELVTRDRLTAYAPDSAALWRTEISSDCSATCGNHSTCQCDIWRGFTQCNCDAGYYMDGDKCEACALGSYKSSSGDTTTCELCPSGMTTVLTGSTNRSECMCIGDNCTDPCVPDPCDYGMCHVTANGSASCECAAGWSGDSCDRNDINCGQTTMDCDNGGTCVDMAADYACVCAWGFMGRRCELEIDECAPGDMCRNNGTCEDRRNNYYCACLPGWKGTHCQDVDKSYSTTTPTTTTTTTAPTTTTVITTSSTQTSSPTTVPSTTTKDTTSAGTTAQTTQSTAREQTTSGMRDVTTSKVVTTTPVVGKQSLAERNRLLIIIGCSIGGAVLLVLILLLIAMVARRRHRRKQHPPPPPMTSPAQNGNISHKFSGFWKNQTVRGGGTWPVDDTDTLGFPSVPSKRHRQAEEGGDVLSTTHEVSEAILTNPRIYDTSVAGSGGMMSGWNSCLQDLADNGAIVSGAIVKVDGTGRAMSTNWQHDVDELERLLTLLDSRASDVPAHVQGGEYHIRSNDGTSASGRTIGDLQASRVLELERTKEYLLVAIADGEVDNGDCRKEIQWITDHINNEGY